MKTSTSKFLWSEQASTVFFRWLAVIRAGVVVVGACVVLGCSTAHYPINSALVRSSAESGYAMRNLRAPDNSDSLLVVLTFSGGGYRAAAMAYAVLEVMDRTIISWEGRHHSLLQEVDLISAVSGGSLAAAYFGLHPEGFFQDFRTRVLDYDMQSDLIHRTLSPRGLWRQTSGTFGRGDLTQELLDERVFERRTYADMPRHRPLIYVNATEMRSGDRFEFTQDQFDHLCSDLDQFPVARAVAASMAVPILMSPVTLWNHKDTCSVDISLNPVHGSASMRRYIHLVDGGVADNTGVRTGLDIVMAGGGLVPTLKRAGFRGVRKMVQIVVDAQVKPDRPEDDSPRTPGILRQLESAFDVPIDRRSASSHQLLGQQLQRWKQQLNAVERTSSTDSAVVEEFDYQVIRIGVAESHAPVAALGVQSIETGLRISPQQIDVIRHFVRTELKSNPEWQQLLRTLSATDQKARLVHTTKVATSPTTDSDCDRETAVLHKCCPDSSCPSSTKRP